MSCNLTFTQSFPHVSAGKESACSAGDTGDVNLIPGLGRSPGEGNGNPLQCSCLENPTDGGAWRATGHRGAQVRQDLATKPLPLLPKSDYFRKILDIQRKLKLMYSMVIQNIKQTEMEHESVTCSSHEVHWSWHHLVDIKQERIYLRKISECLKIFFAKFLQKLFC